MISTRCSMTKKEALEILETKISNWKKELNKQFKLIKKLK